MMDLNCNSRNGHAAFTLVELSIVLVILGLLVGGVLTGQSLIHAAELRKVSSDFSKYETAINAFKDKYFALPGDMTNATAFWGIAGGTGSDNVCEATPSTKATCNGNGDGFFTIPMETYRGWQHLVNAELIAGSFSGTAEVPPSVGVAGYNAPAGGLGSNSGIRFFNWGRYADPTKPRNSLELASTTVTYGRSGTYYGNGVISNQDAWNIDSKLDDGIAATGKIRTANSGDNTNCATYNLLDISTLCTLGSSF